MATRGDTLGNGDQPRLSPPEENHFSSPGQHDTMTVNCHDVTENGLPSVCLRMKSDGGEESEDTGRDSADYGQPNPLIRLNNDSTCATSDNAPLITPNEFSSRRTAVAAMMESSLFMANISQLRVLIAAKPDSVMFFYPQIVLVSFSILSQIIFAILIMVLWDRESHAASKKTETATGQSADAKEDAKEDVKETADVVTQRIHLATVVIVFLTTVTNMFITGLGFEPTGLTEQRSS